VNRALKWTLFNAKTVARIFRKLFNAISVLTVLYVNSFSSKHVDERMIGISQGHPTRKFSEMLEISFSTF